MASLNAKQKQFIEEYFNCNFNAAEAYRRVYPEGAAYAGPNAAKLKNKPHVKEAIAKRMEEVIGDKEELANKILMKLSDVAFEDKKSEDIPLALQLRSIELIGKQLGVYTTKIDAKVDSTININIDIVDDEDGH